MSISAMSNEDLLEDYRVLRKETKHEKRGPGLALSPELNAKKKRCLALKDEISSRRLQLPHDDCEDVPQVVNSTGQPLRLVEDVSNDRGAVNIHSGPGYVEVA